MEILILGFSVIAIAGILIFGGGKLRTLLKGFVGLFVEDLAKTPEGAAAIYNQAIDKAQNDYNSANNHLQRVAGQVDTAKRELVVFEKELQDTEAKCEQFVKLGQFDRAQLFAEKREELIEEVANQKQILADLQPMLKEAHEVNNHLEAKLVTLKKEKVKSVNDIKRNTQINKMYDDMNELKKSTDTDKLLDVVKTRVKETREQAVGARTLHDGKTSTKISRANSEAKKLQSNDYLEQLKLKHGGQTLKK